MCPSFCRVCARATSVSSISGEMDLRHHGALGARHRAPDLVYRICQQRPPFRRQLCPAQRRAPASTIGRSRSADHGLHRWRPARSRARHPPLPSALRSSRMKSADCRPPRADRKADAGADPVVDRSGKGDPVVAPRHALPDGQASCARPRTGGRAPACCYSQDERLLPPTVLMEGAVRIARDGAGFRALAGSRIHHDAPSHLGAVAGRRRRRFHRRIGKPDDADGQARRDPLLDNARARGRNAHRDRRRARLAAIAASRQAGEMTIVPKSDDDDRPRYADLIDPDNMNKEQRCLAEAVYFEARSEPEAGQAAVAQVVLNRVKSGLYPVLHLRRRLPEPPPPSGLPVHLRLRGQGPAHHAIPLMGARQARRQRRARRQDLSRRCGWATHYHADYVRPTGRAA